MGRLSALGTALCLFATALGCDNSGKSDLPPPPTTARSNAVAAKDAGAVVAASPGHSAAPAAAKPPRQLCAGQSLRAAPKGGVKTAAAPGESAPPAAMPIGVGKWTWVNMWAAWCGPCKEEMPRLLGFQSKLSAAGVLIDLAFVSMDDDERQLQRFLEAQPKAGGVRASYWLPEGEPRVGWLAALGLTEKTELPIHALVAPSGQLACVIQGEIEDRDYPALAAFVGAKKL